MLHPEHCSICRDPALLPGLQLAWCQAQLPGPSPSLSRQLDSVPFLCPLGQAVPLDHFSKLASRSCSFQAVMQSCCVAGPDYRLQDCGVPSERGVPGDRATPGG